MFEFLDNLIETFEKNKKFIIIVVSVIIIMYIYYTYNCLNNTNNINNKVMKGGSTCDENYITSITPDENKIVIYYAGKIYDIKKRIKNRTNNIF